MKCQILFFGKNKKNIINLSSAENAQRVVKVNTGLTVYGPRQAKQCSNTCKMHRFRSFCACAKYGLDLCSLFIPSRNMPI